MIPKGTPVVAGDKDIEDVYNGILAEDWDEEQVLNPAIVIQTVIRYPIQNAIIWQDVANENVPLPEGCIYRLNVFSIRASDKVQGTYQESVSRARMLAIEHARQHNRKDCLEILLRHEQGIFKQGQSSRFQVYV